MRDDFRTEFTRHYKGLSFPEQLRAAMLNDFFKTWKRICAMQNGGDISQLRKQVEKFNEIVTWLDTNP